MNKTRSLSPDVPRRSLRPDFTARVMRNALRAKRRAHTKQRIISPVKDIKNMKLIKFIRTVPGAILASAIVVTSSLGAYALSNWFGADITVTEKNSNIMSVDLSSCKGAQYTAISGIDPKSDLHHVEYKITGTPHVSVAELQNKLLGSCENEAIHQFYAPQYPAADFDHSKTSLAIDDPALRYLLIPAVVSKHDSSSITLRYHLGKSRASERTQVFALSPDATFYQASQPIAPSNIKAGDKVMFVAYSEDPLPGAPELFSILDTKGVQIKSLFKTQYDTDDLLDYQKFNVMPLEVYKQLHKQK